ncbi:SRPBCC family protein [Sulfidibacter corallicola]|uniref:SRPBCC family protein n=1 Tax=Sulfidibacter corallicola TaxID=2818388 RepID=A0A8A4TTX5_SULCO|nr:SRPBCC family protein [Sulfidibacter corallicola]QTD49985.1 SRPBCC family protein [Sulfidibacter corallicola]
MKLHELEREQLLAVGLDEAWRFFSSPRNLDRITPPDLRFRIISTDIDGMFPGQILEYRVKAIPFLWQTWVTEIKHLSERSSFVDEQRLGPYAFWFHRHTFTPVDGGVLMKDRVSYAMPFGIIGNLVHRLYVRRKLEWIFDFRYRELDRLFNRSGAYPPAA